MTPHIFIASSTEAEAYGRGAKAVLEGPDLVVDYWRDVVDVGPTVIESLMKALDRYDFGVFVLADDDVRTLRGEPSKVPRDNVIFEAGLFSGRLGRDRTFFIVTDTNDVEVPKDLGGVIMGRYLTSNSDPRSAVATAATNIGKSVRATGSRSADLGASEDPAAWSNLPSVETPPNLYEEVADAGLLAELTTDTARIGAWVWETAAGEGRITEVYPGGQFVAVAFRSGVSHLAISRLRRARLARRP